MGKRKTTEEFIEQAKAVHGNKYDYSKVEYKGSHTKIIIVCSKHGEFEQDPNSHLQGRGCKKCQTEQYSKAQKGKYYGVTK